MITIDFETYSEAGYILKDGKVKGVGSAGRGGLPVTNVAAYAEHDTFRVLCLAYDDKLWIPGTHSPTELFDHIRSGGLVEAHNAMFEYFVWQKCRLLYDFPDLKLSQMRCSAAKARRYSLPGSLQKVTDVLQAVPKDPSGVNLIRRLCVPTSHTTNKPYYRRTLETHWHEFKDLYNYCLQDVRAERDISRLIPDLTDYELAIWQVDQEINYRGVQVDIETLEKGIELLDQTHLKYNERLAEITENAVTSVNQNKRFVDWINAQGVETLNLDADQRKALLQKELPIPVRQALETAELIMSANVRKLKTLKNQLTKDGRLKNQYVYCGADRTGRWSAGGVQLQNITAKGAEAMHCNSCARVVQKAEFCINCGGTDTREAEWNIETVEQAINDIHNDKVEQFWRSPVEILCGVLRGLFTAKPGHYLVCCDFSAIEAVVAACLSGCQWRIDVFATHGKIYEASAAKATGIPFEEILDYKRRTGNHHPARKSVGKVRELAAAYGGWINAWKAFQADKYFKNDYEIKNDVLKWRAESPEIVKAWGGVRYVTYRDDATCYYIKDGDGWLKCYGLYGMAYLAVVNKGRSYRYRDITYQVVSDVLRCTLPSGRHLNYHNPRINGDKLSFMGSNSNPAKGKTGWIRLETYGGRLFENVVQAVAADIQAEAMVRIRNAGHEIVMHTHDEITIETQTATVEEICALMAVSPAWAKGYPLKAAGWKHRRYQKD